MNNGFFFFEKFTVEVVKIKEADKNAKDENGKTPYDVAYGNDEIRNILK